MKWGEIKMSWENIVKKKPLVGRQKELDVDDDGDIDGKDFSEMRKESECRIEVCKATNCTHNENMKCTLPKVNISNDARCLMYSERTSGSPKYPNQQMYSRGQQSFIERAMRTNRQQKEQNR